MRKGAVAREGYKKTELGWIPEDWEVKRLGECVRTAPSYGMNAPAVKFNEKLPVYLRITDISDDGRFIAETKVSVNHLAYKEFYLEVNDIVFARTGASTGKTYLYTPFDGLLVYAGFLIKFSINPEILNPVFLKYFTFTNSYWNWVKIMSSRSGQPGINAQEYQLIKIPLPPLPEQKKSAEILSTWDEAIEKLNSYIEAKKKLKKALMRRLLTGKQRFKEFIVREGYKKTELGWIPEDWEVKRLGELCAIDSENLSNNTSADYVFKYISLENIEQGLLKGFTQLSFKEAPSRARRIIQKNDVLLATVRPNLLSHYFVKDEVTNWVCSTGFSVLRSKNLWTNKFIFYHLFFKIIMKQIESFITGSNYPAINSSDVKSLKIPFPPLPEQKKIAEILSKADEEIDLLNQELEKLKMQKKGLMQKLLTGVWRVKL